MGTLTRWNYYYYYYYYYNYYIWNLALADDLYVLALPLFCWATLRSVDIINHHLQFVATATNFYRAMSMLRRGQGPDLQNILRFIVRLSYVYRKIDLRL